MYSFIPMPGKMTITTRILDNFFTSPTLLRILKESGIAATGTVRANRTEKVPLQAVDDMKK